MLTKAFGRVRDRKGHITLPQSFSSARRFFFFARIVPFPPRRNDVCLAPDTPTVSHQQSKDVVSLLGQYIP